MIEIIEVGVSYLTDNAGTLDKKLADGWEVLHVSTYTYDHEVTERWTLRKPEKSEVTTSQPQNVQVRAIKSIERTSTWSNSAQKNFDFWRCVLDNDEKVNVFDHPDDKRNTFKIVKAQGWESIFADTDEDIEYELDDAPIPVTVTFDGEWFSVVDIQNIGHYMKAHSITRESSILPHYDDFEPELDPPFIDFDDDDDDDDRYSDTIWHDDDESDGDSDAD